MFYVLIGVICLIIGYVVGVAVTRTPIAYDIAINKYYDEILEECKKLRTENEELKKRS